MRRARGDSATPHTRSFRVIRTRRDTWLVKLLQIHPGIHRSHLVGIAVERERFPPPELSDPSLGRLTPARVIDVGVHVRVEAVFPRRRLLPGDPGLVTHE